VDLFPEQQVSFPQELPQSLDTNQGISVSMMDD
jgi:hypothetical protein